MNCPAVGICRDFGAVLSNRDQALSYARATRILSECSSDLSSVRYMLRDQVSNGGLTGADVKRSDPVFYFPIGFGRARVLA